MLTKGTAQDFGYTDGIVAVVNDEVITVYDVAVFSADIEKKIYDHYNYANLTDIEKQQKLQEEINTNRIRVANELVNQKLIYAEFIKKGYQLPNELVEKRIDNMVASNAGGDWSKFESSLRESNLTMKELKEKIERKLAVDLLISQTIDKNINISPQEVEEFYHEHAAEFRQPNRIRIRLIAVERAKSKTDSDHAASVQSVLQRLKGGEDFANVAKEFSHHSSKVNGGDLGWMEEDKLRQEFRSAFTTRDSGEISKQIEIEGVTYILQLSDFEQNDQRSMDTAFEKIKRLLFMEAKKTRYDGYVAELRDEAYVRIYYKN